MLRRLLIAGALPLLLAACGGPDTAPVGGFAADLDRTADRRHPDAGVWEELLARAAGEPGRRLLLARALGRGRWPELTPLMLEALETAGESPEQARWLFALGQTGSAEAVPPVAAAAGDPSAAVRRAAVRALGRLPETEATLPALMAALADDDPGVRGAALIAAALRRGRRAPDAPPLPADAAAALAAAADAALAADHPDLPWQGAYVLANVALPGRLPALARAAAFPDATVRLFAARGLGRLQVTEKDAGKAEEEDRGFARDLLLELLAGEADPHAAAAAAEAIGRIGGDEAVTALVSVLAERHDRPSDHHPRQAAAAALGAAAVSEPALETAIARSLQGALSDPSPRVRAAAAAGLLARSPASWPPVLDRWLTGDSRLDRLALAAAAAAGRSPESMAALVTLSRDADLSVAGAALTALAGRPDGCQAFRARLGEALACADAALCGAALEGLASCGRPEDMTLVRRAYGATGGAAGVELRIAALEAADRLDAAGAEPLLSRALLDDAAAVRNRASELLSAGGHPATAPRRPGLPSSVPLPAPPAAGAPAPRLRLITDRGALEIELRPQAAPRHTASLLDRARQGLLDGLPFHRVVSGFVVQGLDPRGDGWGTGGVFLRDEIHPEPFRRGTVGMPNAGPDSGGCQIFINHVPTPHLDGGYTVMGRVVEGWEVLDALDVGDVVLRAEIPDGEPDGPS